jgi:23S rRNA pseudouridine1911/1915/1917 synthase
LETTSIPLKRDILSRAGRLVPTSVPIFTVEPHERGRRLDKFLAERLPEISRTVIARLADEGRAQVDNAPAGRNLKLRVGQTVSIELPDIGHEDSEIKPEKIPLEILYEDDDVCVVAKPAGICVHPAPGHLDGTLVNAMLARRPEMAFVGSMRRPGVVHRLDLDTSGAIVFALTPVAYRGLIGLIKARQVRRVYAAVVHGIPDATSATISMPIGRDPLHRRKFSVIATGSSHTSKPAVTHYDIEERYAHASLLRVRLDTGRTHQIRVHMQRIGHPVVGDHLYAPERPTLGIARQALHAAELAFTHPRTGTLIEVKSEMPEDMRMLLMRLRSLG